MKDKERTVEEIESSDTLGGVWEGGVQGRGTWRGCPYLREIIPSDASDWRKRGSTRFIRIAIFLFHRTNRRDFPTSSRRNDKKEWADSAATYILTVKRFDLNVTIVVKVRWMHRKVPMDPSALCETADQMDLISRCLADNAF